MLRHTTPPCIAKARLHASPLYSCLSLRSIKPLLSPHLSTMAKHRKELSSGERGQILGAYLTGTRPAIIARISAFLRLLSHRPQLQPQLEFPCTLAPSAGGDAAEQKAHGMEVDDPTSCH